jgi:hypothetical protein
LQVTVPFKVVLQRCGHNREAMLVQSVDIAILADAETAYEIRQDLKRDYCSTLELGRHPVITTLGLCQKDLFGHSHCLTRLPILSDGFGD